MKIHLEPITSPEVLHSVSQILRGEEMIAFDTEFIRENTYAPNLGLIQIATREEAWLVDVLALSAAAMQPLFDVFSDQKILKVLHSALGDQESLYHTYRLTASPTLDTFEAASLVGFGESVSLGQLVQSVMGVTLKKSHARTDWLRRPLSDEMKRYALSDVEYLVEIGERLLARLEELGRKTWAMELSAYYQNSALYDDPSAEIAHRLALSGKVNQRSYLILRELVAWREQRARMHNIPRRRIADDETLMHIANARPETFDQLSKFRGINSGEIKRQGEQILEIIRECLHRPPAAMPRMPQIHKPSGSQSGVIDLLGTYLRVLCEELHVASRQLLTSKELRQIVVENLLDPEQWVQAGICSAQVKDLVGDELTAILKGKRALSLENAKIKIVKID